MNPRSGSQSVTAATRRWDAEVDLLVIGAGIGGLSTALFAEIAGLKTLLCEKTDKVGGTTASSGGIVWAPGNRYAVEAGIKDSKENALLYLRTELGSHFDGELADAFLESVPEAIDVLEKNTDVGFSLVRWPDYHPDSAGGVDEGRTLESRRFDGRKLGREFAKVRPPLKPLMLFGGLQVDKRKVDDFLNPFKSPATFLRVVGTLGRYAKDRISYPRGTELGAGNALVAALYYSLRKRGAEVWTDAPLTRLLLDAGRVTGAEFSWNGSTRSVRARAGVVLATGGFPNDVELRDELSADFPHEFTFGFDANVGEGIKAARSIGAVMDRDLASTAYWQPSSALRQHNGSRKGVLYGYLDRGRPGVVAVDRSGKRFVNESNSYHDVGLALLKNGAGRGNYFHFVCDRTFVWTHGLGMIRPFQPSLRRFLKNGYITVADTIKELATKIGVDPEGLAGTIRKHNEYAEKGIDPDFGKGSTVYNQLFGHPRASPNPNLAPIVKPPFVALRIYPGTLGTAVGLKVNRDAQVLDADKRVLEGLYACGNDMASVMRGCYPAGGITLGPAIAFAYRVASHAARQTDLGVEPKPLASVHLIKRTGAG
jgi:succinate dehydrogenase/fumarate reductase flavoprotein subunit